jgi:malate dehydrogenase (oxaloacetate-decarboxylating)(NADP+)
MKIAAARALAALAREDVPDEVAGAYAGRRLQFGPDYLIPTPFDPRLIAAVSPAVAEAAMKTGVARTRIGDMNAYRRSLLARLDPAADSLQAIFERVKANPKRVVFAEGEEEKTIRAAQAFYNAGFGTPVLIGREQAVRDTMAGLGLSGPGGLEIHNAALSQSNKRYTDYLYRKLQRRGALYRDCQRMVNQDRNVFAACMVALGDADAMVTGLTRSYAVCLEEVRRVIDNRKGEEPFGLTIIVSGGRTVFLADTTTNETPTAEQLANIAIRCAGVAKRMGFSPRVALLSHATFGWPPGAVAPTVRGAVDILDSKKRDFAYDGEIAADVALDAELQKIYPFCRLGGPANVLIMPSLHSASIASKLLRKLAGATMIGPLLMGLDKPVQIARMDSTVSDLLSHAALAAHDPVA